MENIKVLTHSSIRIETEDKKIIYIDPFNIEEKSNDADLIFITHNHYDHFSPEDIQKIKNVSTKIVITNDLFEDILKIGFKNDSILKVKPNQEYEIEGINFNTVPSYNINKKFHPKENGWVGYIINLSEKIYIAGDTDITEENKNVKCDIALIPIGGTYTMTPQEAAKLVNIIKPKKVIPTHYGSVVGKKEDAEIFKNLLNKEIKCEIKI